MFMRVNKFSDSSPAILRDWRLSFGQEGFALLEPCYADLEKAEGEECHGVAVRITKKGKEILDRLVWILSIFEYPS